MSSGRESGSEDEKKTADGLQIDVVGGPSIPFSARPDLKRGYTTIGNVPFGDQIDLFRNPQSRVSVPPMQGHRIAHALLMGDALSRITLENGLGEKAAQLPHGPSPLRNHNAVVSLPLHLPTL